MMNFESEISYLQGMEFSVKSDALTTNLCFINFVWWKKKMSLRDKEWLEGDRLAGMVFCWLICLSLIKFSDREEKYHRTQTVL